MLSWSSVSARLFGFQNGTQTIAEASGIGRTLSVNWVMMPSVPIEPVKSLGKS